MARLINLRTTQGYVPPGAILIDRRTKWGNPFRIGPDGNRDEVIQKHALWFPEQTKLVASLHELRGHDLACWCSPRKCHGELLLKLANPLDTDALSWYLDDHDELT